MTMTFTKSADRVSTQIFFAEYDVVCSLAASLRAACMRRAMAATTATEEQWWDARTDSVDAIVEGADARDRADLLERCDLLRAEFDQIGGLTDNGRF